ncbi:hypothetical protein [Halodesulfovibrio sp.]|jgi:hypothetical protein|uniref:hypothetical protein n=1 Tax=Halodesulfovibrio sp. TaxID=1912772 RepID=UPI0025D14F68|nr:hypothetical protein [Halodesulfovibrio sp.]MCT4533744.1 hypothetical protein [Halodesulfovibrio sp.]
MSNQNLTTSNAEKEQASLPLTAEMVRKQLIERHNQPLSADDPIMMVASMFELFLAEYNQLLNQHQAAIEKSVTTASNNYATKVQKSTDELLDRALQGTISNNMSAMKECKEAMAVFTATNRVYAIVSVISCTISLCLFLSWLFMRGQ